MTDFTYPINTASKSAQRLFDIVRPHSPALNTSHSDASAVVLLY